MVKGFIEKIVETDYLFKVRIPTYHRIQNTPGATPTENLPEAPVCTTPGVNPHYQVGDVVWCDFEDDEISSPVIVGLLYRKEGSESTSDVRADSITANVNAELPVETRIGEVRQSIQSLPQIQQQAIDGISQLQAYADDLREEIASAEALLEDIEIEISTLQTLLGTTSISSIGDGTVTGAINTLDSEINTLDSEKAPTSHASTTTVYGVGTTTNYGHVKTINNLTASSYADGNALAAYQGYVLNQNKAPNSHASTATTYGVGTTANYGHVKTINNLTTASYADGNALAAYQGKVLNDKFGSYLPLAGGTMTGQVINASTTYPIRSRHTVAKGTAPSATESRIFLVDYSNGAESGSFGNYIDTSLNSVTWMRAYASNASNNYYAGIRTYVNTSGTCYHQVIVNGSAYNILHANNYTNYTVTKTWSSISKSFKATYSNTWEYTGLSVTTSSGGAEMYIQLGWGYGAPIGVAIATSSSDLSNSTCRWVDTWSSSLTMTITPIIYLPSGTYYIWERRASVPSSANTDYLYYKNY